MRRLLMFVTVLTLMAFGGIAPAAASTIKSDNGAGAISTPAASTALGVDVNPKISCNATQVVWNGSASDLSGNTYYIVRWNTLVDAHGGAYGNIGVNEQSLKTSSLGILSTSTFYAPLTRADYISFTASMEVYTASGSFITSESATCTGDQF